MLPASRYDHWLETSKSDSVASDGAREAELLVDQLNLYRALTLVHIGEQLGIDAREIDGDHGVARNRGRHLKSKGIFSDGLFVVSVRENRIDHFWQESTRQGILHYLNKD